MKKKGFTLIELLAVIVILAIIALIATPIILSMINNARKSAAKSSTYGYIEAIESNNGFADADIAGYTKIIDGTHDVSEISVPMKGKAPDSGTVTILHGKVTDISICINGYTATIENNEVKIGNTCNSSEPEVEFNGTYVAPTTGQTHKGIVYMDPTDLTKECTASNSVSTTGTKTGCMKFYIYDDSNNQYKMILDHNTSGNVAWNSSGKNADGMNEVATRLSEDATGWTTGLNPRLITADEVAHIVGADRNDTIKWSSSKGYGTDDIETKSAWIYLDGGRNSDPTVYASGSNGWQKQYANSSTPSNYAWLFDYTNGCRSYGCNIEEDNKYPYGTKDSTNTNYVYGYWTSSPVSDNSSRAWRVSSTGFLRYDYVGKDNGFGVRPVITIQKSIIN